MSVMEQLLNLSSNDMGLLSPALGRLLARSGARLDCVFHSRFVGNPEVGTSRSSTFRIARHSSTIR